MDPTTFHSPSKSHSKNSIFFPFPYISLTIYTESKIEHTQPLIPRVFFSSFPLLFTRFTQSVYMRITFSACKLPPAQTPPRCEILLNFPGGMTMDQFMNPPRWRKDKVIFVAGVTGTGKSKLSIDIALRYKGEVVNCDKMQIFKGLEIVTNKVTEQERCGIPHHLMGIADSDDDFTSADFCRHANDAVSSIISRGRVPIIAGGSNSYIKALASDDYEFRSKYECCFLWTDVSTKVLHKFVSERVDRMVEMGLVDEVREIFDPTADYGRGIRQAIGAPELDEFLKMESNPNRNPDREFKMKVLLRDAIEKIKSNTCDLSTRQFHNILRLEKNLERNFHRLDATEAFRKRGGDGFPEAWKRLVSDPSMAIVRDFLREEHRLLPSTTTTTTAIINNPRIMPSPFTVATATR